MTAHTRMQCENPNCGSGCNVCCLFICTVCGGVEATLPTECPGVMMTGSQCDLIQHRFRDFLGGQWITRDGSPDPVHEQAVDLRERRILRAMIEDAQPDRNMHNDVLAAAERRPWWAVTPRGTLCLGCRILLSHVQLETAKIDLRVSAHVDGCPFQELETALAALRR